MDKVFEALDKIRRDHIIVYPLKKNRDGSIYKKTEFEKEFNIIEKALLELKSIKDTEISDALECLERLDNNEFSRSIDTYVALINRDVSETQYLGDTNEFAVIKEALLKAQGLEKENAELLQAVAIFKKKLEDTDNIKVAMTMAKQLNTNLTLDKELTKYKKAWEIIKKKGVDIDELKYCKNVYDYNQGSCVGAKRLTQAEFNFLKEMTAND